MANNCWHSIDTHFPHRAGSMSFSLFLIEVANALFMTVCNLLACWLPKIHDQQSLTLGRCTFSRLGREYVIVCFSYKDGQYFVFDRLQPVPLQITQDTWPTIFDAPLMLISKIGQAGYRGLCCLSRRPEIHLWLCATYQWWDYPGRTPKNDWHPVEADFNVLYIWYLLPSISIWMYFWTDGMPFCLIETQPAGKA